MRIYEIKESFIEFIKINDSTGEGIANVAIDNLEKHALDLYNMRGQGYDNGSNMKGKDNGVQAQIRKLNPLAVFMPCSNHTMNLSLHDAASSSAEISGFFSLVQNIYTFFSGSTVRGIL